MIIGNIEIVTVIVVFIFLIPVLWNFYKDRIFEKFTFIKLIKIFNKSLKIQGVIAVIIMPFSWIWNKFDFTYDYVIAETGYTYIIVGIFMYLPTLGILNFVKLLFEEKNRRLLKNSKKIITLKNGFLINVNQEVKEYKIIEDNIIVITEPKNGKINNENVYCYNFEGKKLWQIEDLKLFHKEHYYTTIKILNNKLYLYNICGIEVNVIPKNGKVISKELIK